MKDNLFNILIFYQQCINIHALCNMNVIDSFFFKLLQRCGLWFHQKQIVCA